MVKRLWFFPINRINKNKSVLSAVYIKVTNKSQSHRNDKDSYFTLENKQ